MCTDLSPFDEVTKTGRNIKDEEKEKVCKPELKKFNGITRNLTIVLFLIQYTSVLIVISHLVENLNEVLFTLTETVTVDNGIKIGVRGGVLINVKKLWLLSTIRDLHASVLEVCQEVDQTGLIVHQLIRNALNGALLKELNEFSTYLLHVKIKFSAWGFFDLDGSLVQSIISSVTTYLVILIQFQMSSPNDHGKQ
ncbi:uncharacterized protein LOC106645075 [Copidosoma floridanum]|uniref:uncharacterized protein LOC106645075 n=1 Tax=Copidosoma floridanum TaxID=29053 RepID=UPI000C6F88DC|nr:uncharacterized protein LOC106645075 [Copidosoma floridanum]